MEIGTMMIQKRSKDLSAPKTLKVTVPTKMHLQLHQLRILSGTNISQTVQAALKSYFEDLKAAQEGEASSQA